jgi:hypothetical protein
MLVSNNGKTVNFFLYNPSQVTTVLSHPPDAKYGMKGKNIDGINNIIGSTTFESIFCSYWMAAIRPIPAGIQ